jgi:hypothetical protein
MRGFGGAHPHDLTSGPYRTSGFQESDFLYRLVRRIGMIDIGIVYYRMGREENTIDATRYTSRLDK